MKWFHDHGYGNSGATSGHLIPDYQRVITEGWLGIHSELVERYHGMSELEKQNPKGVQLRAMMTAATMARDVAQVYSRKCKEMAVQ